MVGVRDDRPCHLHINVSSASHVDQLDVAEFGSLSPRCDRYNSRSAGGGRRCESMETGRGDPDNRFDGDNGGREADGGAVNAPPPVGTPAVEVKSGLVGPARPAAVVDKQRPARPVLCSEEVDGGAELLDISGPSLGAVGGDGGPCAGGGNGGAEVGNVGGGEAAGAAGGDVGGVYGGPALPGGGTRLVCGDVNKEVAGEGGAIHHRDERRSPR